EVLTRDLAAALHVDAPERAEPAHRLEAEEEVPPDRHQRDQRQVLVHRRDARLERLARRAERYLAAVDQVAAGRGPVHAREDPDQRGLARAVVAQQARDLARLDLHAHVLERRDVAEALRDTLDAQQRRAAVRHGAAAPAGRGIGTFAVHADSATVRRM